MSGLTVARAANNQRFQDGFVDEHVITATTYSPENLDVVDHGMTTQGGGLGEPGGFLPPVTPLAQAAFGARALLLEQSTRDSVLVVIDHVVGRAQRALALGLLLVLGQFRVAAFAEGTHGGASERLLLDVDVVLGDVFEGGGDVLHA